MAKTGFKFTRDMRREQVVQASLRVIARKGVSGLTTAALAKEAGVSEANLYRHFQNKDEILFETAMSIGRALQGNLEAVVASAGNPLISIKKVFLSHLRFVEKNEGVPRLAFSEEIHVANRKVKNLFLKNIGLYGAGIEGLVREGQKAGVVRSDIDPRAAALMVIGLVQVSLLRWSLSEFSFSLVSEGRKLWKNFETCIAAGKRSRKGA